jgi:hypothetical protein
MDWLINLKKFLILVFMFTFILIPVNTNAQINLPGQDLICGGECPLISGDFNFDREGIFSFLIALARLLTFLGVALCILMFVWAGIQFIIGKAEEAQKSIVNAIIGLVVIVLAYTAVNLIVNLLSGDFITLNF